MGVNTRLLRIIRVKVPQGSIAKFPNTYINQNFPFSIIIPIPISILDFSEALSAHKQYWLPEFREKGKI